MSGALLEAVNLGVRFDGIAALDEVNFEVYPGETVGLVGESGSGKSTLARALLRLIPLAFGHVSFCGENLASLGGAALRRRRRDLQIVFQDPLASLNPRLCVGDQLGEPLKVHERALSTRARRARVADMLQRVGLSAEVAHRYPHDLSGGQCQRIGIARAMILRPKLLVCDEPVSSLDVSIQGQIINLLAGLQREHGTALLLISHNLAVVRHLSQRVLVMYRGRLVETADCDQLFAAPAHPYTQALLAAVPGPTGTRRPPMLTIREEPRGGPESPRGIRGSPGSGPRFPGSVPGSPGGVPGFPGSVPGFPGSVPGSPGGVPGFPGSVPGFPGSVPRSPGRVPGFPGGVLGSSGCAFLGRCAHGGASCSWSVPRLEAVAPGHFAACPQWHEVVYS